MSTDVVYSAVHTFLAGNWTATDLAWENENYQPRTDSGSNLLPYIAVEIQGNSYDLVSIGTGDPATARWREEGILWLHVMAPSGTGSLTARQYAREITDLFKGLQLDPNIEFRDQAVGAGQVGSEDGAWFRISCTVEWIRN